MDCPADKHGIVPAVDEPSSSFDSCRTGGPLDLHRSTGITRLLRFRLILDPTYDTLHKRRCCSWGRAEGALHARHLQVHNGEDLARMASQLQARQPLIHARGVPRCDELQLCLASVRMCASLSTMIPLVQSLPHLKPRRHDPQDCRFFQVGNSLALAKVLAKLVSQQDTPSAIAVIVSSQHQAAVADELERMTPSDWLILHVERCQSDSSHGIVINTADAFVQKSGGGVAAYLGAVVAMPKRQLVAGAHCIQYRSTFDPVCREFSHQKVLRVFEAVDDGR